MASPDIPLVPTLRCLPIGHPAAIRDATGSVWTNAAYEMMKDDLDSNVGLLKPVSRVLGSYEGYAETIKVCLRVGGVLHGSVQAQGGLVVIIGVVVRSTPFTLSPDLRKTPVGRRLLDFDWASTSLGHIACWSQPLKTSVSLMLAMTSQAIIFWGKDRIVLYNDACQFEARNSESLMGQTGKDVFCEVWERMSHYCDRCFSGESLTSKHELAFFDSFSGHFLDVEAVGMASSPQGIIPAVTETYLTWSYTPIYGQHREVEGIFNECTDTTAEVLLERRLRVIRELAEKTGPSNTSNQFWRGLERVLQSYDVDFPYVLCYTGTMLSYDSSNGEGTERSSSRVGPITHLKLASAIGIPSGDARASPLIVPLAGNDPLQDPWSFAGVCADSTPRRTANPCPDAFERRGWGDTAGTAMVVPLAIPDGSLLGLIVFGINTRRPYDDAYRDFHMSVAGNLSSALAATLAYEQEMRQAEEMRMLDRAKTVFFENVSHELRTPLTLIRGPCEDALKDQQLDPVVKARFKLVHRASGRLVRLVNSLMLFSSAKARRLQTKFRPVNLDVLTANLSSLFRSAVEKMGLVFNVLVDETVENRHVYVDPGLYERILFNLLSNAIKYTKTGSITVRLVYTEVAALLTVEDTGCGIPENQLDRVLERFHRVDRAEARSLEGTGIGLALTNELVRIHSGFIHIRSILGRGSAFTINFPLGSNHLPIQDIDQTQTLLTQTGSIHSSDIIDEIMGWNRGDVENDGASTISSSSVEVAQQDRYTILLAEDNVDARVYIKSILQPVFKDVIAVPDGQAALDFIQKKAIPDLLLTDLMMPRMTGLELIDALENDPEANVRNIPIIVLTAGSGLEHHPDLDAIKESTDFLTKPFSSADLVKRVRTRLRGVKQKQDLQKKVRRQGVELTLTKRRYQRISELAPVAIFETDDADRNSITYANERFFRITGLQRSLPMQFDDLLETLAPASQAFVNQGWSTTLAEGEPVHLDCVFTNGQNVFCELTRLEDGSLLGTFTDQTEQRRFAADQLSAERMKADEAIHRRRQQEAFVDIVSHELRNPLSAIVQSADLLSGAITRLQDILASLKGLVDRVEAQSLFESSETEIADANHAIASIALCTRHQTIIASDILAVSRLESKLLTLNITPFNLLEELQTAIDMHSVQAASQGVQIELSTGNTIRADTCLMADPTSSNSCRILESWDGERRINISASLSETRPQGWSTFISRAHEEDDTRIWLEVDVSDSGPGIPLDDQIRLFTRFNDIDTGHARRPGGAGLGLYLCKKLAELQGGQIHHKSIPGQGASFQFFIEARKASASAVQRATPNLDRLVRSASPMSRTSSASTPSALSSQLFLSPFTSDIVKLTPDTRKTVNVLIVEDNIINQTLLQRQLQRAGFRTGVANNGFEALNYLDSCLADARTLYPSAILMDLEMPVLDGVDATIQIREREAAKTLPAPRVPIFAVTGNARKEQIDTALAVGMDRVFVKPYKITNIVEQLDLEAKPR